MNTMPATGQTRRRDNIGVLALLLSAAAAAGAAPAGDQVSFPLNASATGRYLVDRSGKPFLYQADTAWMLFLKLDLAEAEQYLSNRKAKGFNAVQVMLTGFLGMKNRAGEAPFGGDNDFAQPNEKFFAHVDAVVERAGRMNLLLSIAPAWAGCCREGWAGRGRKGELLPLNVNGPGKTREWGAWLGRRYAKYNNVMWILGGDNDPRETRNEMRALALGLKEGAPHHLLTYHAASSHSSTDVWPGERWIDVPMVYTYFRGFNKAWNKNQPDVYEVSYAEYDKTPPRPFILGESTYEGEHDAWGSAVQARKQAYWTMLSGGAGHAYGSPNWNFPANWREIMELAGAASLKHLRALFASRPWYLLVPDRRNELAVEGSGPFAANDYAVTAVASNGDFAVTYIPSRRRITYNLARFGKGRVKAWWFDPRTGESSAAGEFDAQSSRQFEPPGDGDWLLVLDRAGRRLAAPGGREYRAR